jgi:hypothetical protein
MRAREKVPGWWRGKIAVEEMDFDGESRAENKLFLFFSFRLIIYKF